VNLHLDLQYASGHCCFMAFTCCAPTWNQSFTGAQKRLVVSKVLCSIVVSVCCIQIASRGLAMHR
jgi:hypothetical protein